MKKLALLALTAICVSAYAQAPTRVRGTITAVDGNVLSVKLRDGRDVRLNLAPDAQVVVTKATTLAEFKSGSYVGVTSLKGPDGRLIAKTVHALGPQVPSGHMAWDSIPGSMMTNANLSSSAKMGSGNELTLTHKGGEQKILVTPETTYITFVPGTRADLKAGETIFSVARVEGDGKFATGRVAESKDGVKPPQ